MMCSPLVIILVLCWHTTIIEGGRSESLCQDGSIKSVDISCTFTKECPRLSRCIVGECCELTCKKGVPVRDPLTSAITTCTRKRRGKMTCPGAAKCEKIKAGQRMNKICCTRSKVAKPPSCNVEGDVVKRWKIWWSKDKCRKCRCNRKNKCPITYLKKPGCGHTTPLTTANGLTTKPQGESDCTCSGIHIDTIAAYIEPHEGLRLTAYEDSKGIVTVGIGFNMERSGARADWKKHLPRVDFDKVFSKKLSLTEAQARKLFLGDLNRKFIPTAKRLITGFENMCGELQSAIVDALYRGDLGPKTQALINQRKWKEAGEEYIDHGDYRKSVQGVKDFAGIKPRMDQNKAVFQKQVGNGNTHACDESKATDKVTPTTAVPVYDDSKCASQGGSCMMTSEDCDGSFIIKQCGGPVNRQCCIPTPQPSANSTSITLRMTYELQVESCPLSLTLTTEALETVFTNILAELCPSCKFKNTIKYCGSPTAEAVPRPVKRSAERVKRFTFQTLIGAVKSDIMEYAGSLDELNNELKSYADRISTAITSTGIPGITVTDTPVVVITSKDGKCFLYTDLTYKSKTINGENGMCIEEIGVCFTKRPFGMFPETPDDIELSMFLYTRESRESWNCLSPEFSTSTTIDPNKPTKVIVHGYNADGHDTTDWPHQMRRELLKEGDYNVVVVDWSEGADVKGLKLTLGLLLIGLKKFDKGTILTIEGIREFYGAAATNTQLVGHMIYSMLKHMNVNMGDVHCIGHSLGAHTCGFLGNSAGKNTVGRISGMDPAGPKFEGNEIEFRLDPSDARFVDIIHTDADILGFLPQLGHVDFYPNGGRDQPGCLTFICDHSVSHQLYLESIDKSCTFYSTPCSYNTIKAKDGDMCYNTPVDSCTMNVMGYYSDKYMERQGAFYLKTNKDKPRCDSRVTISPCDTTQSAPSSTTKYMTVEATTSPIYDDSQCDSIDGECKLTSTGCDVEFVAGKCGGPPNRMCCPDYDDSQCDNINGECKLTSTGCAGDFITGKCGGPTDRQCCTPLVEYDDSKCECLKGTCKPVVNGCSGGNFYTGKCGGPADRKCCVPIDPNYNDASCESRQGVCKMTTAETCSCGQFHSGFCGGPSPRRCCISD